MIGVDALLVDALRTIAEATDPDNPESYRADDREGCLDAVHATATAALTQRAPEVRPTDDITVRLDNLAQSLAGEYPPHTLVDLAEAASLITTLRRQINGGTKE